MNRSQRLAATVALAVGLVAVAWAIVPFSVAGVDCGSPVTAAFGDDPPATRSGPPVVRGGGFDQAGTVTRYPCADQAGGRLVGAAVVVGLAAAFTAGSYRLLRADDDHPGR